MRVIGVAVSLDDELLGGREKSTKNPSTVAFAIGCAESIVVAELKHHDLQVLGSVSITGAFEGIKKSPKRGRAVLPRMLIEAPTDSERDRRGPGDSRVQLRSSYFPGSQMR